MMTLLQMPVIDQKKCDGCGLCVNVCHCSALRMYGGVAVVAETKECTWCTYCEAVCATGALTCPFEIVTEGK
ncbi:MAG: 4Fe-4S binding protein [Chloroflexi bacterium]|nr:4Fe-4S binding protein [Chloroflexota bacterium]